MRAGWRTALALLVILWLGQGCRERSGRLRLVFSADTRGMLEEVSGDSLPGGLARRAGQIRALRLDGGPPLLLVDGGNLHGPGTDGPAERSARELVRVMGQLQYDAAVLGPGDGGLEPDALHALMRDTAFRWLTGGWQGARDRWGTDSVLVVERGGLLVGLLDHMDPASLPSGLDSSRADGGLLRRARALRPWVDVLVVVAATPPTRADGLARELEGLADLLLLTGQKEAAPSQRLVGTVRVASLGHGARQLGLLDVEVRKGSRVRCDWSFLPLHAGVRPDAQVLEALTQLADQERGLARGRLEKLRLETVLRLGIRMDSLPGKGATAWYVGAAACRECHAAQWQAWQSSPHQVVWDSLRQDPKAMFDLTRVRRSVTGWLERGGWLSERETPQLGSVQCEACHGRGSSHVATQGGSFQDLIRRPTTAACAACHEQVPAVQPHSLQPLATATP